MSTLSQRISERVAAVLDRRTSRRGFLIKATLAGSALAVGPLDYALRPGTAYAVVCRCANSGCGCGSACCDGYTEFCCTLHGSNTCPSGTVAGGWWKADGSSFCDGARYYVDCHAECQCEDGCSPGGSAFCSPGCDGLNCDCAFGDCNRRAAGCVSFRYGQCHQDIACMGRIACRVVTCTPAYLLDNACGSTSMTDDSTAEHNAPCLEAPARVRRAYSWAGSTTGGFWLATPDGGLFSFGGAGFHGSLAGQPLSAPIVGAASAVDGRGYWLAAADGGVFAFGSARYLGGLAGQPLRAPIAGLAAAPDGHGYWLVASDGGVFAFGSARFFGGMAAQPLTAPIIGLAPAPDGHGYWLVASDGGVFAFGTAPYHGGGGGQPRNALVAMLVPTPSGRGYWLLGQDGGVDGRGDAPTFGSYPGLAQPQPPLHGQGIDAFYGMVPTVATSPPPPPAGGTGSPVPTVIPTSTTTTSPPAPAPRVVGYTLWAVDPLGPPPTVHPYQFGGS